MIEGEARCGKEEWKLGLKESGGRRGWERCGAAARNMMKMRCGKIRCVGYALIDRPAWALLRVLSDCEATATPFLTPEYLCNHIFGRPAEPTLFFGGI